jgi:hypothetical protein
MTETPRFRSGMVRVGGAAPRAALFDTTRPGKAARFSSPKQAASWVRDCTEHPLRADRLTWIHADEYTPPAFEEPVPDGDARTDAEIEDRLARMDYGPARFLRGLRLAFPHASFPEDIRDPNHVTVQITLARVVGERDVVGISMPAEYLGGMPAEDIEHVASSSAGMLAGELARRGAAL